MHRYAELISTVWNLKNLLLNSLNEKKTKIKIDPDLASLQLCKLKAVISLKIKL